jgi:membrane-associated protein
MELLIEWLTAHIDLAPYALFALLVLAGFSLPISEDILLLASGMLASTVMPEKTIHLFMATFLGSLASDVIAFILGRSFGASLHTKKWFGQKAKRRLDSMQSFYKKHGIWALMIGRCIPFGVRNGIFMTAGAAKMRLVTFVVCDAIACFIFSLTLFSLAYSFGSNFDAVCDLVHHASLVLAAICVVGVVAVVLYKRRSRKAQESV